MKRMILILTVLMVAGSSMVMAQETDVIGLYFDDAGATWEDVNYSAYILIYKFQS